MPFDSSKPPAHLAGPTARDVFRLAWPMTIKAIFLFGTVVIDAYLVAALGEASLAAIGLAAAISGFVLGAIQAFANAMQIRTAQAYGTADQVFLKSSMASGMAISLAVGLIGLLAIWVFGGPVIDALAPSVQVAGLARGYLAIFSFVILGEAIGQCISSYLNGCGETRVPLYSLCLAVPVNVAVSIVLIHGYLGMPAMGVNGAAIGSVVAVVIQVAFLLYRLVGAAGHLRAVSGWREASFGRTLMRHLGFALPIAATFLSAAVSTQVCALIYAKLSLNEFAAMTLIGPWIQMTGTVGMQWAIATGIIVAQLLGQGRDEAVLDRFLSSAWRAAFIASAGVAVLLLGVCLSANALYSDLSAETRMIVMGFLPILLLLPFPKGSNAICGNTLRASGDTIYVMNLFVTAQWLFRVPATALAVLWFDFGAVMVLSIQLWEEVLKFPAFHRRLLRGDWKRSVIGK
ncbi:MATE family efflux transporter [Paracoccus sp. 1_MG-2023]|uniref:MATE family efflux transporter n=1 Tax=unclassified Paracoccus (in: a-proteobacteria) TaxID=2688777 RepID=UPI001C098210|nr:MULTISPECIES: MATE family efflux transporter [unclassified Paracoccus (in: a-proteobacteria)]MBU2957961.1 polysaccharide biosynthesis C-terminal domain-containing protein [Paracoccus sp. C2R09]MDO6668845.1 MATE family efflux transporter [Paracoccus sp. 1_MG-2023]